MVLLGLKAAGVGGLEQWVYDEIILERRLHLDLFQTEFRFIDIVI